MAGFEGITGKDLTEYFNLLEDPNITPAQRRKAAENMRKLMEFNEHHARLIRELSIAHGLLVGDVWMHEANKVKNNVTHLKAVQS